MVSCITEGLPTLELEAVTVGSALHSPGSVLNSTLCGGGCVLLMESWRGSGSTLKILLSKTQKQFSILSLDKIIDAVYFQGQKLKYKMIESTMTKSGINMSVVCRFPVRKRLCWPLIS